MISKLSSYLYCLNLSTFSHITATDLNALLWFYGMNQIRGPATIMFLFFKCYTYNKIYSSYFCFSPLRKCIVLWNAGRTLWESLANFLQLLGFFLCPSSIRGPAGQLRISDRLQWRLGLHAHHHRPRWALVVARQPGSPREELFRWALWTVLQNNAAHYNYSHQWYLYLLPVFWRVRCPV